MNDIRLRTTQAEVYNRTNEPGTCLWCGRRLPKATHCLEGNYGRYGDNAFCGLRCGYMFGVVMAGNGRRCVIHHEQDEDKPTRYVYPKCPWCGDKMNEVTSCSSDKPTFNCPDLDCDGNDYFTARGKKRETAPAFVVEYELEDNQRFPSGTEAGTQGGSR